VYSSITPNFKHGLKMIQIGIEILLLAIGIGIVLMQKYSIAKIKEMGKEQGKIKTQVDNLPDLESIAQAQAQAKGKNSVEFNYHIQKEKLIHFEELVKKILSMNSFLSEYLKKTSINANRFSIKIAQNPEYLTYENFEKDTHKIDDFYERIDEIELRFNMYIEVIGSEAFNSSFKSWLNGIQEIYYQSLDCQDLIHDVIVKNQFGDDPHTNEESTRTINGLALELGSRVDKSKVFSDTRKTLFKECGELSRKLERLTSHNADYV